MIVVSVLVTLSFGADPTWTTPAKVHVSAFAVNDYSNYPPESATNLSRSIITKDTFVSSLFSELNNQYPAINTYKPYDYNDSDVTVINFKGAQTYHSEFVFFMGHGNQQLIALYDLPMRVSEGCSGDDCIVENYGKVYGGDTKWVIFNSCLVLNVNKSNMLSSPFEFGKCRFV